MRDIVITSSILIAAVLLIRYLAKGRLAPALQYALWLPVVLRLMLPLPLWSSQISVLNFIPDSRMADETAGRVTGGNGDFSGQSVSDKEEAAGKEAVAEKENPGTEKTKIEKTETEKMQAGITAGMTDAGNIQNREESYFLQHNSGFQAAGEKMGESKAALQGHWVSLSRCLLCIWAAGMLLVGGYMLFYQIKWRNYLRANRKPFVRQRKYKGKLSVYTVENLPSPCLVGRCIYLTEEMAEESKQLAHILAHEYCHYRQLDSLWVIVRCVLTAVYWFHPLVWAAAYVSKQDSELACDAAAIRLLGEDERIAYGKTLLGLIAGNGYDRNRIGLASTMSGGEKGIRERISRIAGTPRYMAITAGVVVLLLAAVIAVTFTGTKDAQESGGKNGGAENLSASADGENGQDRELSEAQEAEMVQEAEQQALALRMAEEQKQQEAVEVQMAALEKEMKTEIEQAERERGVLEKLASYDADIDVVGSREDVYGVVGALNVSDYVQAYYENGDAALKEGLYLLEGYKGPDSSDIKMYGMYSKEYGCEGIKILIGDDVNDFDEKWLLSGLHNLEENLRVYESAEDGMPRTFAGKMPIVNTSDEELWNLYLGDRYDTGTIELYTVRPEELIGKVREQISFVINEEENRIDVYHHGEKSDSITVNASAEAMRSIEEVIVCDDAASWELGSSEAEIRLFLLIGLKLKTTDDIWYGRLPLLSISVSCGSFGDRKIEIGQASVETAYVNMKGKILGQDSLDQYLKETADISQGDAPQNEDAQKENAQNDNADMDILAGAFPNSDAHYDVELQYLNPCPSYTRISDTFGSRINPLSGEELVHNGVDFAAEKGADVLAAADGTVYQTGFDSANGNYIILYHVLNGEYTYYTHCQEILADEGSSVTAGQKIATVGSTGRSTGPHLHFALSRDGEYIEPVFE